MVDYEKDEGLNMNTPAGSRRYVAGCGHGVVDGIGFREFLLASVVQIERATCSAVELGEAMHAAAEVSVHWVSALEAVEVPPPIKKQAEALTRFNYYRHFEKKPRNRNKRID